MKDTFGYNLGETISDGIRGLRKYLTKEEEKQYRKILNIMWLFWIPLTIGFIITLNSLVKTETYSVMGLVIALPGLIGVVSIGLVLQSIRRNVKKRLSWK